MTTWEVWSYDVWGNEKEGFEVNDRSCLDRSYEVKGDYPTTSEIREALGLKPRFQLDLDGDDETVYVNLRRNGYPVGEMILNKE